MFISQREFDSIMNKAYLKGYEVGRAQGRLETAQSILTPNDIRKAFDFPNIVEDKEERLTCKQLLAKEYPDNVGSIYPGGCAGCPHNYGYISEKNKLCEGKGTAFSLNDCEKCWSQAATKYYEKEKK